MFTIRKLLIAGVVLATLPMSTAQAGGFGISIGIPIGGYYRPYPYYGGYYYYRPYPYYYGPYGPTVVVQPAPADAVPVYPPPVLTATPPPAAPPVVTAPPSSNTPPTTIRATSGETRQDEIDHCLAHLGNPDERVRADMAIQLGRMRAMRAVDTLTTTLASDRSPAVRDAAARALGLIGANASLAALDRAAQSDDDRDVRRSAQFAAEVIRTNRGR